MIVKNKTFTYLLPLLGNNINEFYNLEGAFIKNEDYKEYNNHLFLLTKFHSSEYFLKYEKNVLEQISGFVSSYDPDNSSVIHIYEIQDPVKISNYNLFLQGKYSKMSEEYKQHIIKFHHLLPRSSIIGVLYKLEYRYLQIEKQLNYDEDGTPLSKIHIPRDQEISDPPYMDRETYYESMKIYNPFKLGRLNINKEEIKE